MLDHQQSSRAERHDAIADFRADRTATAGHDDRFAADKILKPPVVDLDAGPQQKIFNGHRRQLDRGSAGVERRHLTHDQAEPARADQDRFRAGFQRKR